MSSPSDFKWRRERIALRTADMVRAMRRALDEQLDTFSGIEKDAAIDLVKGLDYAPEEAARMLGMNLNDLNECVEADDYAAPKRPLGEEPPA